VTSVLNDLFDYGLKIYQDNEKFKFSLDSILLAEFVDIKPSISNIVDFCTGNAPVPMILSTKTDAKIYGFEIQDSIYKLAKCSVMENCLDNQISIYNASISEVLEYLLPESMDVVTCNPPYFKYDKSSLVNMDQEKAIARHEITTSLEDIIVKSKYVLKNKGKLYMVHRCDRLEEIMECLRKYNFAVKKMQFIYAGNNRDAIMVLIKATKNGNVGSLKIAPGIDVLKYKSYKNIFER